MYYPLQIPNLLNKKFREKIEYKEYRYKELEKCIICIWSMQSMHTIQESMDNVILPDGCIDLIINKTEKQIFFSGFSKATEFFELIGNIDFIGIRFRPGVFHHVYKKECCTIMDTITEYSKIERNNKIEKIFEYTEIEKQLTVLVEYLQEKTIKYEQNEFELLVEKMNENLQEQYLDKIVKELGYSQRQINRLFYKHYGVNPKTLINIVRLHKCLEMLFENNRDLTKLALNCGFYDQSHFIKEIKKYCGISPIELIKKYKNV